MEGGLFDELYRKEPIPIDVLTLKVYLSLFLFAVTSTLTVAKNKNIKANTMMIEKIPII